MRVIYVSQYFPPESGAAPERALHMCRALRDAGHEVSVITGLPNHPSGVLQVGYEPGEDLVVESGVRVIRVPLYASPRKSLMNRLRNQLTFAYAAGRALRGLEDVDLVVASAPPTFLGIPAVRHARAHSIPLMLDVRDDWPGAAVRLGHMHDGLAARILQRLSDWLYGHADRLIVVTEGMRRRFEASGIASERMTLIMNGTDVSRFDGAPPLRERVPGDSVTVVYAGTHGLIHCMEAILDAVAGLDPSQFSLLFVGDGVAKQGLVDRCEREALQNVEFLPMVAPDDVPEVLGRADICIATTCAAPFCGETVPVKLFDYMASGRPLVAAVLGDAADVVRASSGGIVVPPESGSAIRDALLELARNPAEAALMGEAGARFVRKHYSRSVEGEEFSSRCEQLVAAHRAGRTPLPSGSYRRIKRSVDVFLSLIALVLLSPLLLAVSVWIRLESPGPALFRQRRSGRWSHEFVMYKFRSMHSDTPDVATHLLDDASSFLTRSGCALRRSSIDELPQLINVLRGEMSIVGPRPALHNQRDLIGLRREADVDALRPGITGWAQVNGRDDLPMEAKVRYDREYLDRVSLRFDIYCVYRTIRAVLAQRGAR